MSGQSWGPVDSSEAREQREAEEAAAESERASVDEHTATCVGGWRGEDDQGRPVPCLTCRPWLALVACWTCQTRAEVCDSRQLLGRGRCCRDCDHKPRRTT